MILTKNIEGFHVKCGYCIQANHQKEFLNEMYFRSVCAIIQFYNT